MTIRVLTIVVVVSGIGAISGPLHAQGLTSSRARPLPPAFETGTGRADSHRVNLEDSIPPPMRLLESQTAVSVTEGRILEPPFDRETSIPMVKEMSSDGVWSWFGDPRSVRIGQATYVGWVTSQGDIRIGRYDHGLGSLTTATLLARLQVDDHANPSILGLEDGRLMVFFSPHAGSPMLYRTSLYPENISAWGPLRTVPRDSRFTYPNPIRLPGEGNKIFLFWRNSSWKPAFSTSSDGLTWSPSRTLLDTGSIFAYVKYVSNGRDRIHFAFTDTHPEFSAENNIYHAYYENGAFFRVDGTRIGDLNSLPLLPSQVDVVYAAASHDARAWISDIALDENGYPVIAYTNYPSIDDHRYRYARWTGQRWSDHEITRAGGSIDESGDDPYYTSGIILDHENPAIVFLCRESSGAYQLERWITIDRGETWVQEQLTSASTVKNLRPVVPLNRSPRDVAVLWLRGEYSSYTSYHTSISFLSIDAPRLVSIHIKPGPCPERANLRSHGALPAAILGSPTVDVHSIDLSSLRLAGARPLQSHFGDHLSPPEGGTGDCVSMGPDGFDDLHLKFSTEEVSNSMPDPENDTVTLQLTGRFTDGTPLLGGARLELIPMGPRPFALKAGGETEGDARSIRYSLPREARVELSVYDVRGRKVATLFDSFQSPGTHSVSWNPEGRAKGVYFLRCTPPGILDTHKVLVLH